VIRTSAEAAGEAASSSHNRPDRQTRAARPTPEGIAAALGRGVAAGQGLETGTDAEAIAARVLLQ